MPDYNDPQVLAALRAALDNEDNWKEAAMPRRAVPVLPGEFSKDISKVAARVGLPAEFGPYARAAEEIPEYVAKSFGNTIRSAGDALDPALTALRKYLSR